MSDNLNFSDEYLEELFGGLSPEVIEESIKAVNLDPGDFNLGFGAEIDFDDIDITSAFMKDSSEEVKDLVNDIAKDDPGAGVGKILASTQKRLREIEGQIKKISKEGAPDTFEKVQAVYNAVLQDDTRQGKLVAALLKSANKNIDNILGDTKDRFEQIIKTTGPERDPDTEKLKKNIHSELKGFPEQVAVLLGIDLTKAPPGVRKFIDELEGDEEFKRTVVEAVVANSELQVSMHLGQDTLPEEIVKIARTAKAGADFEKKQNEVLGKIKGKIDTSNLVQVAHDAIAKLEMDFLDEISPKDSGANIREKFKTVIGKAKEYGEFGQKAVERLESISRVLSSVPEFSKDDIERLLKKEPVAELSKPVDNKDFKNNINRTIVEIAGYGSGASVIERHKSGHEVRSVLQTHTFFSQEKGVGRSMAYAGVSVDKDLTKPPEKSQAGGGGGKSTFPFRSKNIKKTWSLMKTLIDQWTLQASGFSEKSAKALKRHKAIKDMVKGKGITYVDAALIYDKEEKRRKGINIEITSEEEKRQKELKGEIKEKKEKHLETAEYIKLASIFMAADVKTIGEDEELDVEGLEDAKIVTALSEEIIDKIETYYKPKEIEKMIDNVGVDTEQCVEGIIEAIEGQIEMDQNGKMISTSDGDVPVWRNGGEFFRNLPGGQYEEIYNKYLGIGQVVGECLRTENPTKEFMKKKDEIRKTLIATIKKAEELEKNKGKVKSNQEVQQELEDVD